MSEGIDPGALKFRITLEEPEDTPDGAGGAIREWGAVQEFWAELKPVVARPDSSDGSMEQRITYHLIYRAGPDLTMERRLRMGARLFNILGVRNATDDGGLQLALIEEIKP